MGGDGPLRAGVGGDGTSSGRVYGGELRRGAFSQAKEFRRLVLSDEPHVREWAGDDAERGE